MSLLERFKNLTTGTPLRTLISSLTIALLIPITLFASTQTWELRRSAVTTDSTQEEAYFKFTDFRSPFDGSIGDTFIFKLADPEKITHARSILDGSETELIRPKS